MFWGRGETGKSGYNIRCKAGGKRVTRPQPPRPKPLVSAAGQLHHFLRWACLSATIHLQQLSESNPASNSNPSSSKNKFFAASVLAGINTDGVEVDIKDCLKHSGKWRDISRNSQQGQTILDQQSAVLLRHMVTG